MPLLFLLATLTASWSHVTRDTFHNPLPLPPSLDALAGYNLHYGRGPHSMTHMINVGNSTHYQMVNVHSGTLYFAVSAYTARGVEGPNSKIVRIQVP